MNWQDRAYCKGLSHLFFSKDAERPEATVRREAVAHSVCAKCPVFDECKQHARDNGELGYWAGENEYDRYLLGFKPKVSFGTFLKAVATYSKRKQKLIKKENQTS